MMAEIARPLLILPEPGQPGKRRSLAGGLPRQHRPNRKRQAERLAPLFARLDAAFTARRARLTATASGLVPEEVIVLETVGPVDTFFGAVKRIRGMEWLGEYELEDIPPDDDFFAIDSRGVAPPRQDTAWTLIHGVFGSCRAAADAFPSDPLGEWGEAALGKWRLA